MQSPEGTEFFLLPYSPQNAFQMQLYTNKYFARIRFPRFKRKISNWKFCVFPDQTVRSAKCETFLESSNERPVAFFLSPRLFIFDRSLTFPEKDARALIPPGQLQELFVKSSDCRPTKFRTILGNGLLNTCYGNEPPNLTSLVPSRAGVGGFDLDFLKIFRVEFRNHHAILTKSFYS